MENGIVVWAFSAYIATVAWAYPNLGDRALFGDSFGGLNVQVSTVAFIALAYTIRQQSQALEKQDRTIDMQKTELGLQRDELALTRKVLERSAIAQRDAAEAEQYNLRVRLVVSRSEAVQCQIEALESMLAGILKWRNPNRYSSSIEFWISEAGLSQLHSEFNNRDSVEVDEITRLLQVAKDLSAYREEPKSVGEQSRQPLCAITDAQMGPVGVLGNRRSGKEDTCDLEKCPCLRERGVSLILNDLA
ncbi:MAG: hypothetical protein KDN22_13140 [Verrucomicrobiae bacterium]|nr:hypothetical protein [Verrucomicrobiae bacterium]